MQINRDLYLDRLVRRMHNGMIKVVTGIRRAGKSYLLFEIFYSYLLSEGVDESHIIKIALDDRMNIALRDPDKLCSYVHDSIKDKKMYYILLDEVQFVDEFEDVLNSFLHIKNADVYVIGSNARFLSKDIITEFRGRGDQVHIYPLSFSEYLSAFDGSAEDAWNEYKMYGGLPFLFNCSSDEQKIGYLTNIFKETYIKDIVGRYNIDRGDCLEDILNIIASSIGSFTNPHRLENTFLSEKNIKISAYTIGKYLDYLCDSFLIDKAIRYDVKGRKYISSPLKYYFSDIGLRNARLQFRQDEESHIMENILFNELKLRGYNVDIGTVIVSDSHGSRKQLEVDFICTFGSRKIYIQSALNLDGKDKMMQESRSLLNINDSFSKMIVVKDNIKKWYTEDGILIIGIRELLTENEFI